MQILDMVSHLKGAFDELLTEADWMDDETRRLAKEKVGRISKMI